MKRDELDELLDKKLTKFFGQFSDHFDKRFEAQRAEFDDRFDRLETMMDAVTERIVTDDQERAAIISEQNRHHRWIGQLAEGTGVKLTPPLPER